MIVYDSNGQPYEADLVLGEQYRELEKENKRLENIFASGIHSCHENCQRPLCVLRRRAEKAEARVKELEFGLKHQCETCEMKSIFDGEHDLAVKAQARVKELEKQNELLICDRARFPDKSCEVGNIIAAHIENLKSTSESNAEAWRWACVRENALKERNDELVAALEALLALHDPDGKFEPHGNKPAIAQARAAIARAESYKATTGKEWESAAPAKHPDTERLDWLEDAPSERLPDVRKILWQQHDTCTAVRAAIDAARKEVQHD